MANLRFAVSWVSPVEVSCPCNSPAKFQISETAIWWAEDRSLDQAANWLNAIEPKPTLVRITNTIYWPQTICANHIVWDATEVVTYSRKHTANVTGALDEIRDIVGRLVAMRDQRKDAFYQAMKSAMTTRLGSDVEEARDALAGHGIPTAASVRGERYSVIEGKTPEITVKQARKLLQSIETTNVIGLRDKCIVSLLIYTAARIGAVAKLRIKDLYDTGDQDCLHFIDKGGKSREIPVRHDLQQLLFEFMSSADFQLGHSDDRPLFLTANRKTKQLTHRPMTDGDMQRMIKRRMKVAGLPTRLTAHSFRVTTITDLLSQGVPLEEVQHLAGHADPRTTRLYDRRQRKVTRNIVERISI